MTQEFALSDLSKHRLKRGNQASYACAGLALLAAAVINSWWVAAVSLYFIGKVVYRRAILHKADPHVVLSDEGVSVRWFKATLTPWSDIDALDTTSEEMIEVAVKGGAAVHIRKRRIEGGAGKLSAALRDRLGEAAR